MHLLVFTVRFLVVLWTFCLLPVFADAAEPLRLEGKKSVYQRLVTHPGAKLYSGPGSNAQIVKEKLKTFSIMYIYAREGTRLQVGGTTKRADGWIDAALVTEWPQAITMVFTDRTSGRAPVLFFRDHEKLLATIDSPDTVQRVRQYQQALQQPKLPADFPVIATEPQEGVAQKNFYLLPVLNFDDSKYNGAKGTRLVEVASIDPGTGKTQQDASEEGNGGQRANEADIRVGYAFVIDTTISMKPYIDQTVKLIHKLYDDLEKHPNADKMAFAVVAFRSSMEKTPEIGYTAKVVCDFTTVKDRKKLEAALSTVEEATVSTHDINEDSFAGIKEAVEKLSWKNYSGRFMLLVTDAGPLQASDPTSQTGFSPETLRDYLNQRNMYITVAHIIDDKIRSNPKLKQNKKYAKAAYEALSRMHENQSSYLPVNGSSSAERAEAFDRLARTMAESYSKVLTATATGQMLEQPRQIVNAGKPASLEDEARRIAESQGYAVQLQFLGDRKANTAPHVVKAWISDVDLEKWKISPQNRPIISAKPCVLLTKGQLSNLHKQLTALLQVFEDEMLKNRRNFFDMVRSAAAQMNRDPGRLNPDADLVEMGLLDEVIEGLPYKSTLAGMTRESFESMSSRDERNLISRLKTLIRRYEVYDQDRAGWESFGSGNPNDWVYRVPLTMLP